MLGIDVSKNTLVCAWVDPDKSVRRRLTVTNDPAGWRELLAEIPAEVPWVLEPTGRFSAPVARAAVAAGRRALLAPSRSARYYLASRPIRGKADQIDCVGLGCYAYAEDLRPYPLQTADVTRLTQLLAVRGQLTASLSRFQQQQQEFATVADTLTHIVSALREQLAAVDTELAALAQDKATYPRVQLLDEIPGIGPVTAATLGACLQDKRFTHPDAFVAYVGLDLRVHESGQSKGVRRLTKEGPGELRRLLYLAAQANLRCKSSPFKDQYERERAKGLSTTAALCAVARKLAKVCWSIDKYGTHYQADRVNQAPARSSTAATPES